MKIKHDPKTDSLIIDFLDKIDELKIEQKDGISIIKTDDGKIRAIVICPVGKWLPDDGLRRTDGEDGGNN